MRIVELNPEEERAALHLVDRFDRVVDDERRGPRRPLRLGVAVESLRQARLAREEARSDRRCGCDTPVTSDAPQASSGRLEA